MTNQHERQGGSDGPQFSFDPVQLRYRHDGWTPERQVDFIRALAASACVIEACRAVGMSSESAYTLRAREGADSFCAAWDAALRHALGRVADGAVGRAINGVATPIFYKGEQVGERRRYNDRLAMFLLGTRGPCRCGGRQGAPHDPPGAQYPWEDPRFELDDAVERLAYEAERWEREMEAVADEFGLDAPYGLAPRLDGDFPADVSPISSTSGQRDRRPRRNRGSRSRRSDLGETISTCCRWE